MFAARLIQAGVVLGSCLLIFPCSAQETGEGGWTPPWDDPVHFLSPAAPPRGARPDGLAVQATDWRTEYELTEAEYLAFLAELKADGLRPVSVVARTAVDGPRFAVVAHADGLSDWLVSTSLTNTEVQAWADEKIAAGYAPVAIAAHGAYPEERYSAVAVKSGDPRTFTVHPRLTAAQLQTLVNTAVVQGRRVSWVAGSGSGASIRYAAIVVDNPTGMGWWIWWGQTEAAFANQLETRRRVGSRPASLSGFATADSPRFTGVAHFRRTEDWEVPYHLPLAEFLQLESILSAQGWYPTTAAVYETPAGLRAAGVFVAPTLPRLLTVTGIEAPELKAFDDAVIEHIKNLDVPNAALAVVKDGRLVLARGYTYAPAEWPTVTEPDTLFRIASMSKPLCSVAMHQAAEKGLLHLDDFMVDFAGLGGWTHQYAPSVTLRYMLQHRGGWNRDTTFDPLVYDANIAAALQIPLPIAIWDIIEYMKGRPFQFVPGSQQVYSNFGFTVDARALESVDGRPFEQIVRQDVLAPLGVHRARVSEWTGDRPGETRYLDGRYARPLSVMSPDQEPLDGLCYGGYNHDNFEAPGGWMFSAVDYARFLTAFDDLDGCPLLPRPRIEEMWEPGLGDPYDGESYLASGWIVRRFGDAYFAGHSGRIPGGATFGARTEFGVTIVIFQNQIEVGDLFEPYQLGGTLEVLARAQKDWPDHDLWPMFCPGDFNRDRTLDFFDFLAFVNAFNAGQDEADFSGDAQLNLFDFLAFVNIFNGGC